MSVSLKQQKVDLEEELGAPIWVIAFDDKGEKSRGYAFCGTFVQMVKMINRSYKDAPEAAMVGASMVGMNTKLCENGIMLEAGKADWKPEIDINNAKQMGLDTNVVLKKRCEVLTDIAIFEDDETFIMVKEFPGEYFERVFVAKAWSPGVLKHMEAFSAFLAKVQKKK